MKQSSECTHMQSFVTLNLILTLKTLLTFSVPLKEMNIYEQAKDLISL